MNYEDYTPTEKLQKAIKVVKALTAIHNYKTAFSGGKDSCLIEYIIKEAKTQVPNVYNMTTIDPPGTIAFCRQHHCNINRPNKTFLQLVQQNGLPTMFKRYCCRELKEVYISDYIFTGVRRDESVKRKARYCEFENIRHYNKTCHTAIFMPILYFTNNDVEYLINDRQIECHPIYYDDNGTFCVKRRLGCLGCPLQSNRGVEDYLHYPKLLYQVAKNLIIFHHNHGRTANDAYENLVYNLFYSNHGLEKFNQAYRGLFHNDAKSVLESYFNITLP